MARRKGTARIELEAAKLERKLARQRAIERAAARQDTPSESGGAPAGASPGLLGSLFYMLGSVYALPLHMLYVFHVIKIFDNIMGPGSYNLFSYFGALILFQLLVDSIPDNFNPFSIGFIGLVTLSLLSAYAKDLIAIRQVELRQRVQV